MKSPQKLPQDRTAVAQAVTLTLERRLNALNQRRLNMLATIGATAPFIGLFGTVWGIMNSFQSIALTRETSLVAVAPGIAEALFATALGLFVAIPAVIFYNRLNTSFALYAQRADIFGQEVILTIFANPVAHVERF